MKTRLTISQAAILNQLHRYGELDRNALQLAVPYTGYTHLIGTLERRGYIVETRGSFADNPRLRGARILPRGIKALQEHIAAGLPVDYRIKRRKK